MVFPSLLINSETGLVSQISLYGIIFFAYLLNRAQKLMIIILFLVVAVIAWIGFVPTGHTIGFVPGACGTTCMLNYRTYYGTPWGMSPVYPYPTLPYPLPSYQYPTTYFPPFGPSPYINQQYCVTCAAQNQYYNMPLSYNSPWSYYGMYNHPNYSYPGVWYNNSIYGPAYPGQGNFAAAKPNVYFSGQKGMKFNLKIKTPSMNEDNIFVAIPAYDKTGWDVVLDKQSNPVVGGVTYPYLFYDIRTDDKNLQNKKGFCTDRTHLIPRLADILEQQGFNSREIGDFTEYWSVKMPPADEYCVFPQVNIDLDFGVKLEISPVPARINRIVFAVLDVDSMTGRGGHNFTKRPVQEWSASRPSSSSPLEVREWGVGFIMR